jgi:16S rRNA A1518/A1519 N6-dimethyltransferase RsmA/KsgA/DIM1 with predicted DNA glycosylase/AP lyase activity
MPYSYHYFKDDFKNHLTKNFQSDIKILDVGPGSGSYYDLLCKDFTNIDAVEVYEPYIDQFELRDKYKNVYNQDILEFNYNSYNYLILGDVLEHLSIEYAQNLLADLTLKNIYCMVAVPYQMEQEAVGGNIYEIHKQDDLTIFNFTDRFPMMKSFRYNRDYGMYFNYNFL